MNKTLLFAALCAATLPAHAVDGDILITQAKALAGNVTPGDMPGFPVTISLPGKYKLAGNLVVNDYYVNGIEITHPHVTLDLNGFVLQGPVVCAAGGASNYVNCSSDGLADEERGHGIKVYITGAIRSAVLVQDGMVTGFAGPGISGLMGDRPVDVLRMRVTGNGGHGVAQARSISDSTIVGNKGNGSHQSYRIINSFFGVNGGWGIWGGWVRDIGYVNNTLGTRASNTEVME
jgi:hypothetical protein